MFAVPCFQRRALTAALVCPFVIMGARFRRRQASNAELVHYASDFVGFGELPPTDTSFVGVPVYNYKKGPEPAPGQVGIMSAGEDHWIIMLKPDVSDAAIQALCKKAKERVDGAYDPCENQGHPTEGGISFIKWRGTEQSMQDMLAGQLAAGKVDFIEPVLAVTKPPDNVSDVMRAQGLDRTPWGLKKIGAPSRYSGKGVHVYVLDTGIRTSHQDFGGRAIPTVDVTTPKMRDRVYECKGQADCAQDKDGHGTHCAGTIAGKTYGVAPNAMVHAVKVLADDGSGSTAGILAAMDWVSRYAPRPAVMSMSLGGEGRSMAEKRAVEQAVKAGVTVVVAAGNENDDACKYSPAFVPAAISTGATTPQDSRASFSNYGSCVDIWAPGEDILSAGVRSDRSEDTMSGTSMACPHVSGAAALLLDQQKTMTPAAVRKALLDKTQKDKVSGITSSDTNKLLYVR